MAEWKEYFIRDVGKVVTGKTPPTKEGKYYGGTIPFICIPDLAKGKYVSSSNKTLTNEGANAVKNCILPKGSIMVSCIATIGSVGITTQDISVTNQQINSLIPDKDIISPEYGYYYFKNLGEDLEQFGGGGSIFEIISKDKFSNIPILLPQTGEQIQIASILSSLDDKIDLLHRQNKTLEALAKTLFRQWFVPARRNGSEGGEEAVWNGKLSEYIKVQGGFAFRSKDFREIGFAGVIKITNITMGSIDIRNTQFVDEDIVKFVDEDKFRVRTGDFLIAMTGAEIGKIGIVEKTAKQIWLNQRVGKLVEKVPYGNLVGYLALKSREGQEHIINTCSGSAQENISSSGIEEMDFIPYSEDKVNRFGAESKPLFEKVIFNMEQIRTLTQLRDTLLPKLMSGDVRVKQ